MKELILVITTTGKQETAENIINSLFEDKIAACVHREEIDSSYRWQNKINHAKEYRLTIKTKKELYTRVESVILQNHDYATPQIFTIEVSQVYDKYLGWVNDELQGF